MSKKQNKKNKKKTENGEVQQEEWIEMLDLRDVANVTMSKKFAEEEGKEYVPQIGTNLPKTNQPLNSRQNLNNSIDRDKNRQKNEPRKLKKTSIPMMQVTCEFCTVGQSVPGNTQVYICGSCENMNECWPLYGVCICGCCEAKICFGFGTSQFIKCSKCSSVNRVPSEPVKKYQSSPLPRPNRQPSIIRQDVKKQKVWEQERQREYDEVKYKENHDEIVYPAIREEQHEQSEFAEERFSYPEA